MKDNPLHVTIIGAGLGGLCLAQGLKKNNIAFDVYEKDAAPDSRTQGYRLRIDRTGQDALACCLPDALFSLLRETCSTPSVGVRTINSQLENITGKWVDDWHDDESDTAWDIKINRMTMKQILLIGIQEHVHFDKHLVSYDEQSSDKVISYFDDGSSVISDILIGADGVNSRVRELRFPTATPLNTGDVCLYAKTILDDESQKIIAQQLQSGTTVLFDEELAVVIDAMRFYEGFDHGTQQRRAEAKYGLSRNQDYIYWAMIGTRARFGFAEHDDLRCSPGERKFCIAQIIQTWSPVLKALFELTEVETTTLVPVQTAQTMTSWLPSRVSVLGDAIHVMSPASGLGANSALYDAAILVRTLNAAIYKKTNVINVVAEYEQQLRDHSFAAVSSSRQGGKQLFGAPEN